MSTILLIRHGESQSNVGLPTSSPQSAELTAPGSEQAECIGDFLESRIPPTLIVTSSYQRTKQTAAPTKLRFPLVPEIQWDVEEFTYLCSEDFPALSNAEDRRPLVEAYWEMCDPTFVDGPGAESFVQFIGRVRNVIKRIKEIDHETIAVFSHEQFIRAVLWISGSDPETLDARTMQHFRDLLMSGKLPNGAILRTEFQDSQEPWEWELITSHLDERKLAVTGIHPQK
jgi:broad specificity phosphatase PhoE